MAIKSKQDRQDAPAVGIYRKQKIGEIQIGNGDILMETVVLGEIGEFLHQTHMDHDTGKSSGASIAADSFEFEGYGVRVQVRLGDCCDDD